MATQDYGGQSPSATNPQPPSQPDGQLKTNPDGSVVMHDAAPAGSVPSSTAGQVTLPTSADSDPDGYLRGLYETYINSLKPSQAVGDAISSVSAARKDYQDTLAARDTAVIGQEGQGRGQVLPYIRGEQARIQRLYQPELARKQSGISIAQDGERIAEGNDATAQKQNLARYQFEQNLATTKAKQATTTQAATEKAQSAAQASAIKNNITQPMYRVGNLIYDTATGQPKYKQVGQEIQTLDGQTRFPNEQAFFQHSGINNWGQIQDAAANTTPIKLGPKQTLVDPQTGRPIIGNRTTGPSPSSVPKPTSTAAIAEATNKIDSYLTPRRGQDGYVSPEDYNAARDAWVSDGHPVSTFDSKFSKYVNAADPQDYKGAKVKPKK